MVSNNRSEIIERLSKKAKLFGIYIAKNNTNSE